jgi:hypothetical protein
MHAFSSICRRFLLIDLSFPSAARLQGAVSCLATSSSGAASAPDQKAASGRALRGATKEDHETARVSPAPEVVTVSDWRGLAAASFTAAFGSSCPVHLKAADDRAADLRLAGYV